MLALGWQTIPKRIVIRSRENSNFGGMTSCFHVIVGITRIKDDAYV